MMMICQVVGHVWATKKEEKLNGHKLMIVREETTTTRKGATFVAADSVGAGIGEMVLVVSGSTARRAIGEDDAPLVLFETLYAMPANGSRLTHQRGLAAATRRTRACGEQDAH